MTVVVTLFLTRLFENAFADLSPQLDDYSNMHGPLLELQKRLEVAFPACSDLSSFGDRGFTPHLSIGQFRPRDLTGFVERLRTNWETIDFDVTSVALISRHGYDDPFAVRNTINFGVS